MNESNEELKNELRKTENAMVAYFIMMVLELIAICYLINHFHK